MLRNLKQFNLPQIEERVLNYWQENKIFEKTLANRQRRDKRKQRNFVFFEGPPTANGRPGTHHVLARVYKDIILRYKTMQGYFTLRKAGWDTQGLPVEIEVEKELGLKSKKDIEQYGIARFNQKAKESVWKYRVEWEKLTERIGFWLDFNNAYVTYHNDYLETLWWIVKQINQRGLLKKSYKVVPYCWRCQTSLSSHELAQPGAYKLTTDPSIYIKFKLKDKNNEFLLVWTTTPWTLPANVAVAVSPQFAYKKFKVSLLSKGKAKDEEKVFYVWSMNTPPQLEGAKVEEVDKLMGKELVGWQYEALYPNNGPHQVYAADFVSAEEGTGLVHIAPAFGEDDFNLMADKMKENEIPITVDDEGRIDVNVPGTGKLVKEADNDIILDLKTRNLLYYQTTIEHEYPFCWRCGKPLIYKARSSWFIEMSKLRRQLVKENETVNWIPAYVKEGRFGNWIKEAKDWAISRERYWGTPLPIWECSQCHHALVVGGLADLDKYSSYKNKFWIMRHAEAENNVQNITGYETTKKFSLTALGLKQAQKAAELLVKHKISVIYSSPLLRAKQTCEIVNSRLKVPVHYDQRLAEINLGVLNNKPIEEVFAYFNNRMDRFTEKPEGGESWLDVKKRMADFINEINRKHKNENILIVSHGDPLWLLEAIAYNWNNEEALRQKDKNLALLPLAGFRELPFSNWPRDQWGRLDLHRPYIDEIKLKCPKCQREMSRVPDLMDVWFDSGAMPFAQWHYPFENKSLIDDQLQYPADYICEAMDQTRGWFYTLLAVAVLLKKKAPYKNVVSLGLLVDKYGRKMSKSKGNVVDPWELINKYGADAVRWYFYTVNQPGDVKRFDERDVGKVLRRVLLILYNSYAFWHTYSDKAYLEGRELEKSINHVLDKWVLQRLNQVVSKTTEYLNAYQIYEAAGELEKWVDDISRWYIRRSRERFFAGSEAKERMVAASVLRFVLLQTSKLLAPFVPFFAEALYLSLKPSKLSIHLEDWPDLDVKRQEKEAGYILEGMREVRRLSSLALAKRAEAGIKVRQPLALLEIKNAEADIRHDKDLLKILAEEVNVKKVKFNSKISDEVKIDTKLTPALKKEGLMRELVRIVQSMRQDAGLKPQDKIILYLHSAAGIKVDNKFLKRINAEAVNYRKTDKFDVELETNLSDQKFWLGLQKL